MALSYLSEPNLSVPLPIDRLTFYGELKQNLPLDDQYIALESSL
jgi:hypothetical protein